MSEQHWTSFSKRNHLNRDLDQMLYAAMLVLDSMIKAGFLQGAPIFAGEGRKIVEQRLGATRPPPERVEEAALTYLMMSGTAEAEAEQIALVVRKFYTERGI